MTEQPTLSAEQEQAISDARRRVRPIRRAVGVAKFDAWCTGLFAGMTLLYVALSVVLHFSLLALVVGVVMVVIAYNSFAGAGELQRFEARGAKRLGINQLVFFAMIAGYCVVRIIGALVTDSEHVESFKRYFVELYNLTNTAPQMSVDEIEQLVRLTIVVIYGAVIVASLLVQGLTAVYYFTRAKHVRRFVRDTPQWVVALMERA